VFRAWSQCRQRQRATKRRQALRRVRRPVALPATYGVGLYDERSTARLPIRLPPQGLPDRRPSQSLESCLQEDQARGPYRSRPAPLRRPAPDPRGCSAAHRYDFHPWRYLDNRRLLSEFQDTIVDPAWEVSATIDGQWPQARVGDGRDGSINAHIAQKRGLGDAG